MAVRSVKSVRHDPLDLLYNAEILALADAPGLTDRLRAPQVTVQRTSPLCGSRIELDLDLGADGRVSAYGQTVKACTLGKAAAGIMARHVVGASPAELRATLSAVRAMLKSGEPAPADGWAELRVLEPAREFKSRHGSVLLAFEAVAEALDHIEAGRAA